MSEALAKVGAAPMAPAVSEEFSAMLALVTNPAADVEKLRALVELHERAEQRLALRAFNEAMTAAQSEMQSVAVDAYNSQTKSKYATYQALDSAVRPIYARHGFGLSFTTERTEREAEVRVVCLVSHRGGYVRRYEIDMPADGKGAKGGDVMTRTHATGAAVQYGMRYLLKMIFNVATGEKDDDGNSAGRTETAAAPDGFDAWLADLEAVADEGMAAFSKSWNQSREDFRNFAAKHRLSELKSIKAKAQGVKRGA